MEEVFDLVDEIGNRIGSARRSEVHGDPSKLHPVVHCMVSDGAGRLLLQLRHRDKDIQPGKWDTSVGGHIASGEAVESALVREVDEEIGLVITPDAPRFLYRYVMRNEIESELVHTYTLVSRGPFTPQASEVEELRWWSRAEIDAALGRGVFTPNFEDEYQRFRKVVALDHQ